MAPLIILPHISQKLGKDELGAVMTILAILAIAYVITDYGFNLSATRKISKNHKNLKEISNILSIVFTAKIPLVFLATLFFFFTSYHLTYEKYGLMFLVGVITLVSQAYQPLWLFHGLENMKIYTIYMSLTKILYITLIIMTVHKNGDGFYVLLSLSIANLISTIIAIIMLKKIGLHIKFSTFELVFLELKETINFFWSRIAVSIYTSANILVVGSAGGLQQVSIYSIADQFYKAGQAFTSPISQALYPYLEKERDWPFFFKIVFFTSFILLIFIIIATFLSRYLITLLFGASYIDSAYILNIMLATLLINYLAINFGYPAYAIINKLNIANYSVIIGAIFHLIVISTLILLSNVTLFNVAITTLATELLVLTMRLLGIIHELRASKKKSL